MNTSVADAAAQERKRQMKELSIGFDGRRYEACGYHYDQLADAVNYAQLMRTRQRAAGQVPAMAVACEDRPPVVPDAGERELMAELKITLAGGSYQYLEYRYEKLADAVNYARRLSQRP